MEDKEESVKFLGVVLMLLKAMMIPKSFQAHSGSLTPCGEDLGEALDRPGRSYIPFSI